MRKLGTVTIGQAPRSDITPILHSYLPAGVEVIHIGVLDGLSREDIERGFAPRPGQPTLVTRLLDGNSVTLDKAAVLPVLQLKLDALDALGYESIIVLCTGEFEGLQCANAWLIEPDRIIPLTVAALAGKRQVGIVVPLESQIESECRKWADLGRVPLCATASPYEKGDNAIRIAARRLRDRGAEMIVLDCMGFVERHGRIAQEASGLPVIVSNVLIARLTATLL
ncbi:AroM family protein [Burkholderia cepacia]|uniref:AroM family protein n=1 Tax=Burkholderia cepacia TaxID=292 RepID=UPI0009BDBE13|nr:AroM family protein [Burkholderia cepacia]